MVESISGCGASYMANQSLRPEQQAVGYDLLRAALIIQLVVIVLFMALASRFLLTCRRHGIGGNEKLKQVMVNLYVSNALILTRCVFRTVEFFEAQHVNGEVVAGGAGAAALSPVVRYEVFFYVFEAGLMLANMVLFNVRHPRRWLPKCESLCCCILFLCCIPSSPSICQTLFCCTSGLLTNSPVPI